MYDPLTFFYNRRLTGAGANEKGGESVKFHSIPDPQPDEITLRVGDQTPEGRKIMVDLGDRMFKETTARSMPSRTRMACQPKPGPRS